MSATDPNSFASDLRVRGSGQFYISPPSGVSKPSLTSADAADVLYSGRSWSRYGSAATVTFAFRSDGTPPDTTTSGFTPFSAQQIVGALRAFASWSDVANITFVRVDDGNGYSNNASILLGNFTSGDAAGYTYFPGRTAATSIAGDVWLNGATSYNQNPTVGNYGGQVLVHEIGHSIGLTHPSDYDASDNQSPTYVNSADYYEDSRQYTVMSYFNEPVTDGSFGSRYAAVPLLDDIAAIQKIYGANLATRTGDSIYGFHSNTGLEAFSSQSRLIFAVWDAGGTDTFDFSGYSQSQVIDLRQGAFSSVGGYRGNVAVAQGAVIENAIGGSGNDVITGNASANDLDGGAGNDILFGEGGDDRLHGGTGDDILDGGSGTNVIDGGDGVDQLLLAGIITDFRSSFGANGFWTIVGNGITDIVSGIETVMLRLAGSTGGSTNYAFSDFTTATASQRAPAIHNAGLGDFNGDGHSDLLFRNISGALSTWWIGGPQGDNQVRQSTFNAQVDTSWRIVETMDATGDGRSDILWRNTNGTFALWTAAADGSLTPAYSSSAVGLDWRIAGVGDVDGDQRDDIVWQQNGGALAVFKSTGDGFQGIYYHASPGADWKIAGIADVNADGRADIVWRNDNGAVATWTGIAGGFSEGGFYDGGVPTSWHIQGLGDFDGDGRSDIVWRNDNGSLQIWQSTSTGFTRGAYNDAVSNDWHIAQIGDFNGDGRADIAWRNDNGTLSIWEASGAGFAKNVISAVVPTSWTIESHDFI